MEQHPVPRNISSFEFHLVGDMTLRQFAYLAAGIIIAYIIYRITPLPGVIRYPLVGIVGLSGLAFAFLPIQERPLDKWLVAFIKSIYAPTQYLWEKECLIPDILIKPSLVQVRTLTPKQAEAHKDVREKLHSYMASLPSSPHQVLNTREQAYINRTLSLFGTPSSSAGYVKPAAVPIPIIQPKQTVNITPPKEKQVEPSQKATTPVAPLQPISSNMVNPPPPNKDFVELKKQLDSLASEKENLMKELALLKETRQKLEEKDIREVVKPVSQPEVKTPTIKTISPKAAVNEVGVLNIPQAPNIVIGIIKDGQKRILPNIILTIKDNKGTPLRALKTNKLGQFETATPLPNGTYLLEIEDPLKRYVFDIAQISLSGKVFQPIEITAKGEKELMREKLTKELFGNDFM